MCAASLIAGLSEAGSPRPRPKYLYDGPGLEVVVEAITELPEYYPHSCGSRHLRARRE